MCILTDVKSALRTMSSESVKSLLPAKSVHLEVIQGEYIDIELPETTGKISRAYKEGLKAAEIRSSNK